MTNLCATSPLPCPAGLAGLASADGLSLSNPFQIAGLSAGAFGLPDDPESPLAGGTAGVPGLGLLAGTLGMPGGMSGAGGGKRRSRGNQMADLIKLEQDCLMDCEGLLGPDGEYCPDDSRASTQSPSKRGKGARGEVQAVLIDSDYEEQRVGECGEWEVAACILRDSLCMC